VTGGAGPLDAGPLDDARSMTARSMMATRRSWRSCAASTPRPTRYRQTCLDRVTFALALEDIDLEVLRMREESNPAAVGGTREERSRTITFDSDSLTIMISLSPSDADDIRIDGWLAPPAAHRVRAAVPRPAHGGDRRHDGGSSSSGTQGDRPARGAHRRRGVPGECETVVTPSIVV